jgi:hypothetical protein
VIDGGTWEHRKRAKEMLESADKNLELTLAASGSRHMGDYLPKVCSPLTFHPVLLLCDCCDCCDCCCKILLVCFCLFFVILGGAGLHLRKSWKSS